MTSTSPPTSASLTGLTAPSRTFTISKSPSTAQQQAQPLSTPSIPPFPSSNTLDFLPLLTSILQNLGTSPSAADVAQLATNATEVKLAIQKAKREVAQLGGVDRSIDQLKGELEMLKEREQKLTEALKALDRPTGLE
jgi:hypothetical protein